MDGGRFGDSSEDGYELEIPQGALPPDVDQLDVTIQPHIGNSKKRPLPEGTELVSGVYDIQSTEVGMSKAVSFACDHCCDVPDEDHASLRVVRAREQGEFEPVDNSQVEVRRSSVVLKLKELATSCLAVVATVAGRRFVSFCGIMYRLKKEGRMTTSLTFHFIVIKDLNVCIKAVEARYEKCAEQPCRSRSNLKPLRCPHNFRRAIKVFEPMPIHFASDPEGSKGRKLTVDVGTLTSGWKIDAKSLPVEIREDDAYRFLPTNERHPLCELHAVTFWKYPHACFGRWALRDRPGRLKMFVHLHGTTSPRFLLIEDKSGQQPFYGTRRGHPAANCEHVPTMDGVRFEGPNKRQYIPYEIGHKYREFGTFLLEDHNGAKVQEIERECHSDPYWINYEIYSRWLQGEGRKPVTWATLIGVLRDIEKSTLADNIEAKLADSATPPVDSRTTPSTADGGTLSSEQSPTMMALLKFEGKTQSYDIRQEIGSKYRECCTFLLNDRDGAKLQAIEGQYQCNPLWINHEIFSRWLQGKGRQPVTWATLVGVLRDIRMDSLADDICAVLGLGTMQSSGNDTAASSGDVIMPFTDDTPRMMGHPYDIYEQIGAKISDFDTMLLGSTGHDWTPDLGSVNTSSTEQSPTMMALLKFEGKTQSYDIRQEVGSKYRECCTFLLNDRDGAMLQAIEGQYQRNALWINHEIFSRWLQGEGGKPVTWATLVGVLRDIRMNSLADDICTVLGFGTMQSSGNDTAASSGDVIMPSTGDTPTVMELLNFEGKYDIREQIGIKYSDFGTTLLDCSAATISALEKHYQHDALWINHEIFSRWLQGQGKKPVTWATLIEVLLDIGEGTLADEIGCGTTPSGPRLYLPPLPSRTFTVTVDGGRFGDRSEDGYELEIPRGALPPGVVHLDVTIQPHISNSKKRPLPEDTELVSGVYEMQCTDVRLRKAVSFTCDHCCDVPDEDRASLCVVRAHEQGGFEPVDDSQVEIRRSSVVLKLTELAMSCCAVVATVAIRKFVSYCGITYCLKKEDRMATSVTFHFTVVKDLNFCIKAIEARYEKCAEEPCHSRSNPKPLQCPHNFQPATKVFEPMPIHFASYPEDGKQRRLTVDVEQEGILSNGWKILSKFLPAEIREDNAYHFLPERHPICELVASWENQDASPGPLKEYIHLHGTTRPRSLLIKHNPEEQSYGDDPTANRDQVPILENIKFEGQNKQRYISDQIGSKYREFGTFLLEDHNGAKVQEIQTECYEFYWINYEIFSRWLQGEGRKPVTWATLVGVLRGIGKSILADNIEAKLANSATPSVYHRTTPSTADGDALSSEQSPTMMALLKFKGKTRSFDIREEISIRECCTSLLNDQDGAKFQAIEGQFRGNPLWISHEIFSRWLQGEGRKPVTWATLVGVLGEIGMHSLADEMKDRIGCATTTSGAEKTMGHSEEEIRMKSITGVRPDLCPSISAHGAGGKELDKNQVEGRSRHTVRPSGVEFLSNAMVRVSGSQNDQVVLWEKRGFRMYIPGGALDESEEREIALSTSHSGSFELPVGTFPVSFVYYVEPSGPFRKNVTLEIEHCCSNGLDKLEFAFAESSSKNPPYKFVRLDGGKFPMHSSCGRLEVSHFSLYTVLRRVVPPGREPTTQSPLGADVREIRAQSPFQPTTQSPLWGDVGEDRAHPSYQLTTQSPLGVDVHEDRAHPSYQPTTQSPLGADVHEDRDHPSYQPTTQSPLGLDARENRAQAFLQPTIQTSVEADSCQYRAHLFHQRRSKKTWHVVLVVTERLAECSQVVQKKFTSWRETMEEKALQFKAACQELSIDISDDGDRVGDGVWKIFPLSMPPEITRSDIHGLTHKDGGYTPANCEMKIKLQKEDSPQSPIEHVLVLRGLRRPTKLRISIDPEEHLQGDGYDRDSRNGLAADVEYITPETVLKTKHLPDLINILSPAAFKWYSIGLQLYIQPGRLDVLGQGNLRGTEHLAKMLIEWLNIAQPHPTVSSLVRALKSPAVVEVRLAEDVHGAFEKLPHAH